MYDILAMLQWHHDDIKLQFYETANLKCMLKKCPHDCPIYIAYISTNSNPILNIQDAYSSQRFAL